MEPDCGADLTGSKNQPNNSESISPNQKKSDHSKIACKIGHKIAIKFKLQNAKWKFFFIGDLQFFNWKLKMKVPLNSDCLGGEGDFD